MCILHRTTSFHKSTFTPFLSLTLVILATTIFAGAAKAESIGQISESIQSLWQERSGHQETARNARQKASAAKSKAGALHVRLEKTQQLLLEANAIFENYLGQIKETEAHIVETRHRKQIVTKRYNRHMDLLKQRLVAMQCSNPMGYLEVLLGAHTFSELSRRIYLFNAILDQDARLQGQLKEDKAELATLQNTLMSQWQQRNELVQASQQEKSRIYLAQQDLEKYWKEIKSSQYEQWAYVQAQQQSSREVAGMIQDLKAKRSTLIAQYKARQAAERAARRRKNSTRSYKTVTDENGNTRRVVYQDRMVSDHQSMNTMSEDFQESGGSGRWALPVRAPLSSRFGRRYHPTLHRYKLHTGDDLAASYGTPFHAARNGTVLYAGWKRGYGNTIIIDHGDGFSTLYGHASKLAVSSGQQVRAGQYIGNVGSTGYSTGPHLHFEVRKNGTPVNPMPYLKKAGF